MQAAGDTNIDVKIEIQSELISVNTVITKIKQELREINDMVESDGRLDVALGNAIKALMSLAKETGVTVEEPVASDGQEENPMTNVLSQISTGYITEKLKELTHDRD